MKNKQKLEWQKKRYDKAPRDSRGSLINQQNSPISQDLIKTHKNNPILLSDYDSKRLRESGVVSEKRISQSQQIRKKHIALKKEGMLY